MKPFLPFFILFYDNMSVSDVDKKKEDGCYLSEFDDLFHDALDCIDGDRESNPTACPRGRVDRRIDTNDSALTI